MKPKKKPKVLVVNRSSHDYSMAEDFGELVFMTEGNMPSRYAASKMFRAFEPFIKESKKTDFILLTSMTIMCSIACSMFASKHGRLNLLLYKQDTKAEGRYIKRTIIFGEML